MRGWKGEGKQRWLQKCVYSHGEHRRKNGMRNCLRTDWEGANDWTVKKKDKRFKNYLKFEKDIVNKWNNFYSLITNNQDIIKSVI